MTKQLKNETKTDDLASLALFIKFGGYFAILFGFINAISIFTQGFTDVRLGDTLFNIVIGVIILVCAYLLSGKKLISMWIFGSTIVFSLVYIYLIGRGVNYFYAALGAIVLYKFFKLKKDKEIV